MTTITKTECEAILEKLTVLGHPVTMLDVLAKMDERERNGGEQALLMLQWREFGFKTLLRDILEGATWEKCCNGCGTTAWASIICCPDHPRLDPDKGTTEVLKDKKVEALFLFLKSLGL